jgi:serine-type D-Ala-D-Ala carboxypeptidase/endopeptidase (penicillin-binding protein 4)
MKLYLAIILILLTLMGCGTSKTSVSTPDPLTQLRRNINYILSDSLFLPARASIKVVSLMNEEVLYERDSKALMNPASNIKLLTSAAALSVLDTNYRFLTSVFIEDNATDGIVDGNIYLKGYGDPNLTTADLDSLAFAVRRSGITTITRNIIVDDSYFDDYYWGAGWTWDDESDPDAPYINALSVNNNCIKVSAISDSSATFIYLEPMTDFVTIINRAKVSDNPFRGTLKIRRLSQNNPNTILIEGELPRFGQVTQKLALRLPEYYAGTLFKESLRHAGVIVCGNIVNGIVPNRLRAIVQHTQPIEKMITNMNKVSDNLSAENTLKI